VWKSQAGRRAGGRGGGGGGGGCPYGASLVTTHKVATAAAVKVQ